MIIYKAENKINGKVYIGQTSKSLEERKKIHLKDSKGNSHYVFHRALRKYGDENFKWSILSENNNIDKINAMEKFYIMAYRKITVCYNSTDGGGGILGMKHSDETKIKIKEKRKHQIISDDTRKKLSEIRSGRKLSDYHRKRIAECRMGQKHSQESLKKMSLNKKNRIIVAQISKEDNSIIKIFDSINKAEIETGINHIGAAAKNNKKAGGYFWRILNEN